MEELRNLLGRLFDQESNRDISNYITKEFLGPQDRLTMRQVAKLKNIYGDIEEDKKLARLEYEKTKLIRKLDKVLFEYELEEEDEEDVVASGIESELYETYDIVDKFLKKHPSIYLTKKESKLLEKVENILY
jgi:tRNA G10  N-methylase Trm11